jgi:hypothetical protein
MLSDFTKRVQCISTLNVHPDPQFESLCTPSAFHSYQKKGTSNFSMNKERANNYSFTQKIHMLALKIRNHSSSKTKQVSIITYLSLNSSIIWTLGFVVNSKINF